MYGKTSEKTLSSLAFSHVSVTHKKSSAREVKKSLKMKDLFVSGLAFTSAILVGVRPSAIRGSRSSGRRLWRFTPPLQRRGERGGGTSTSLPTSIISPYRIHRMPGNKATSIQFVFSKYGIMINPGTFRQIAFDFYQQSTAFTPASITPPPGKRSWRAPKVRRDCRYEWERSSLFTLFVVHQVICDRSDI